MASFILNTSFCYFWMKTAFFFFSFLHDEFENTSKHITLATIDIPVNIKTGL